MEVLSKTNGFTSGSALRSTRLSMPLGLAANESTTGFRNHFYDDGRKVPLSNIFIKTSLPICSYRSYHREFEAPEGAFPVASLPQACSSLRTSHDSPSCSLRLVSSANSFCPKRRATWEMQRKWFRPWGEKKPKSIIWSGLFYLVLQSDEFMSF